MKLAKAIELLTYNPKSITEQDDHDFEDAQDLAIEALKRIQDMRISPCTTSDELLPGETPPDEEE